MLGEAAQPPAATEPPDDRTVAERRPDLRWPAVRRGRSGRLSRRGHHRRARPLARRRRHQRPDGCSAAMRPAGSTMCAATTATPSTSRSTWWSTITSSSTPSSPTGASFRCGRTPTACTSSAARRGAPPPTIRSSPFRSDPPANGIGRRITERFASVRIVENGRSRRVPLIREDDYRATYGPLISLISERCTNDNSLDLALGRPMDEYRFVIALTFEQLNSRRARHLRAMVIWEKALLELARDDAAGRCRRASHALPHAAGDREAIPRASRTLRRGQGVAAEEHRRDAADRLVRRSRTSHQQRQYSWNRLPDRSPLSEARPGGMADEPCRFHVPNDLIDWAELIGTLSREAPLAEHEAGEPEACDHEPACTNALRSRVAERWSDAGTRRRRRRRQLVSVRNPVHPATFRTAPSALPSSTGVELFGRSPGDHPDTKRPDTRRLRQEERAIARMTHARWRCSLRSGRGRLRACRSIAA